MNSISIVGKVFGVTMKEVNGKDGPTQMAILKVSSSHKSWDSQAKQNVWKNLWYEATAFGKAAEMWGNYKRGEVVMIKAEIDEINVFVKQDGSQNVTLKLKPVGFAREIDVNWVPRSTAEEGAPAANTDQVVASGAASRSRAVLDDANDLGF